jgi:hypothetical protein
MTKLKSTIPEDHTGLLRGRCKYTHPKSSVYILAFFTQRLDGTSIAEWTMYDSNDNDSNDDHNVIIDEQISPSKGFDEMVKYRNYEGCEFVPSK